MAATLKHIGPETWEQVLIDLWDVVTAARQQRGKAHAAELATKALAAIVPAEPAPQEDACPPSKPSPSL